MARLAGFRHFQEHVFLESMSFKGRKGRIQMHELYKISHLRFLGVKAGINVENMDSSLLPSAKSRKKRPWD
jgi:hypothetical protein